MVIIRLETQKDISAIYHVNQKAFGQSQEADIVDKLRKRGVLTISIVALGDSEVVGHIAFSPVKITSEKSSFKALALAPISVLPSYQNKGIGSQLVIAGLKECYRLGHYYCAWLSKLLSALWFCPSKSERHRV